MFQNSINGVFVNNVLIQKNIFVNIYQGDTLGIGTTIQNDFLVENNIKLMLKLLLLPIRNISKILVPPQDNQITSSVIGSPKPIPMNSKNSNVKPEVKIEIDDEIDLKAEPIILTDEDEEDVKKERILGLINLCDDEEIVISDDEDWFHSQSFSNEIKQELEDLKGFESDDSIICVEEKELLERWRQKICRPINVKPEPIDHSYQAEQTQDYDKSQVKILSVVSLGIVNTQIQSSSEFQIEDPEVGTSWKYNNEVRPKEEQESYFSVDNTISSTFLTWDLENELQIEQETPILQGTKTKLDVQEKETIPTCNSFPCSTDTIKSSKLRKRALTDAHELKDSKRTIIKNQKVEKREENQGMKHFN